MAKKRRLSEKTCKNFSKAIEGLWDLIETAEEFTDVKSASSSLNRISKIRDRLCPV